jgi:periplasmic protein CpxP/Spy
MNKKIITIAPALALPLTAAAFPGDKGDFKGHHVSRIERQTRSLESNTRQKTNLEAIFKEQEEKFKIIHQETGARLR